jgi:hypothetical protein
MKSLPTIRHKIAGDVPDGHPAVSANPNRRLSSFPVAFARPSVSSVCG